MADDLAAKRRKAKESFAGFMSLCGELKGPDDCASSAAASSSAAVEIEVPRPNKRALSLPMDPRVDTTEMNWYSERNDSPTEEPSEEEGG